jgi:hypothetical protein
MCLFAAIPIGLAAAAWALHAGWHPLLALAAYSFAGSFALVLFTLVSLPRRDARPLAHVARMHSLPASQST